MKSRHTAAAVVVATAFIAVPAPAWSHETHRVQPGETLWSIAAARGTTTAALAAANSLSAETRVLSGQLLELPAPGAPAEGTGTPGLGLGTGPQATAEVVSPALVQQVAMQHGVSPSLAAAIAHQESGFSNAFVSPAGARGVMQLLPVTWDFVQGSLSTHDLEPASAEDNVHAGVIYLAQLLRESGGDPASATAAYYQGLASVRAYGLFPETQAYVDDVMALRGRYGGP